MLHTSQNASEAGNTKIIILAALAVLAGGAGAYFGGFIPGTSVSASQTQPASGSATQDGDQTGLVVEPGNPVVGRVGETEIKRLDVFNFIRQLPENMRQLPVDQMYPLALEQVINQKIIEDKVESVDLSKDERVQEQLKEAQKNIERTIYMQDQVNKLITEDRLKEAYEDYKENFPKIEEVKASHILVDDEELAKDLIAKLNDGADFAELAKENSKDATAQNGGDLGYFERNKVVPEFGEAAFNLANGDITKEPIKSEFGFHIIKVEDKRNRPPATFEQAQGFLTATLRRTLLDELLEGWKDDAKIVRMDINGEPVEKADQQSNAQ